MLPSVAPERGPPLFTISAALLLYSVNSTRRLPTYRQRRHCSLRKVARLGLTRTKRGFDEAADLVARGRSVRTVTALHIIDDMRATALREVRRTSGRERHFSRRLWPTGLSSQCQNLLRYRAEKIPFHVRPSVFAWRLDQRPRQANQSLDCPSRHRTAAVMSQKCRILDGYDKRQKR